MWVWGGKPRSGVLGGSNLCSCVTTAWNRRSEIAVFPFMHIDCYVTVRVSLSCSFVLSYRPSDVQSSILHRCAGQTDGRSYSALPPTRAQHTSGSTRYIQHRIMSRPSRSLATVDYRGQDEDVEMPVKKQKTSSDDVFADLGFGSETKEMKKQADTMAAIFSGSRGASTTATTNKLAPIFAPSPAVTSKAQPKAVGKQPKPNATSHWEDRGEQPVC